MRPNNCDPGPTPGEFIDDQCPKCGAETEAIAVGPEGPPVEHLRLCPKCYVVTWTDKNGLHVEQGLPLKKGEGMSDKTV